MNHKNITPGTLVEGSVSSTDISSDEINQLKAQIQDMQLEIDFFKETINVFFPKSSPYFVEYLIQFSHWIIICLWIIS